ncbi:MAG: diaminobutyrate--2-oxoglutarate transaminase [Myxococcales bacterium]|jgi:diaminobutyrate-2-oxoglutarate transaminase
MKTFEQLESNVRSYCRSFPTVFTRARGSHLYDRDGREFIDFFAGAGVMNYGHNHPQLAEALIGYIQEGGIAHGLDMATEAKERFLQTLERVVLEPRGLKYKVMFPGPTGTNAVESALKIARKVTGRRSVVAFTNAFHGMTLGSLAITGNAKKRNGAQVPLNHTTRAAFDGYHGPDVDTVALLDRELSDTSSGIDKPAAIIVETVQGEGGVNVASAEWLRRLQAVASKHGALFIIDDIQVGCGRTGHFFSFEEAGITPDVVCLSKALSGFGLPLAVVLMRPELDQWNPGEHNGTFRGNNHAFVTGARAFELFWGDGALGAEIHKKGELVRERLQSIASSVGGQVRGRGLIWGLEMPDAKQAGAACRVAFDRNLIIETSGPSDEVIKVLPPLNIETPVLEQGLDIVADAVDHVQGKTLKAVG